ncbi:arginine--tRNA ligase, partial [Oleiphilus sp. HI0122]
MKEAIAKLIETAINELQAEKTLPADLNFRVMVDNTKDKSHGDFATNIALMLAKQAGSAPRNLAESICKKIEEHAPAEVEKMDIAGPGFINFFVSTATQFSVLNDIFEQKESFGRAQAKSKERVQVEFVSANPTGPLHVGHGRGAAYGATVSDFLEAAGYEVEREYYVNDAGRQMNILAASVWLRYLESFNEDLKFPVNGYKGAYIYDIAKALSDEHGERFSKTAEEVFGNLPKDEDEGGDKELYIDAVIERARALLGNDFSIVFNAGRDSIVDDIRDDLGEFGVHYQQWFSEASLADKIDDALARLDANGFLYEQNGAIWFKSTAFGDDKDRVVKRDNGETTYFASDIAYHLNKFERGYDRVVNVWGADHHGYIARVKAALQAMDLDP